MTDFLPYGKQQVLDTDIDAVVEVLRSPFLTTGPAVSDFEKAFQAVTGSAEAVVCANGTAALHLASMCLDLQAGDAVIVPSVTFVATANAPHMCGAEVVFADVDSDTGLITPEHLGKALKRAVKQRLRVRAVLPVHLNGQIVDVAALRAHPALAPHVEIIEDASHAVGARQSDGHPVGSCVQSAFATFSFHPVKTITCGEGGMVTCASPDKAEALRRFRNHGLVHDPDSFTATGQAFEEDSHAQPNPWYYEMPAPGLNYRATDIACALGHAQLKRLPEIITQRTLLVERYREQLSNAHPAINWLRAAAGTPAWHLAVALIDFERAGTSRAALMKTLRERNIGTQVHYLPVHRQPYYRRRNPGLELRGADEYYRRCLSLPLFAQMTTGDVDRVVASLLEALTKAS